MPAKIWMGFAILIFLLGTAIGGLTVRITTVGAAPLSMEELPTECHDWAFVGTQILKKCVDEEDYTTCIISTSGMFHCSIE